MILLSTSLGAIAQSAFDKKIADAIAKLECAAPDHERPVTLNAGLLSDKDSIAVMVKVRMASGWHIYQYVPTNMPYIAIDQVLTLPDHVKAVGKWTFSKPFPSSSDPGVLIYENDAWFVHKLARVNNSKGIVKAGLYYQACDLHQCLPPVEEVFELSLP